MPNWKIHQYWSTVTVVQALKVNYSAGTVESKRKEGLAVGTVVRPFLMVEKIGCESSAPTLFFNLTVLTVEKLIKKQSSLSLNFFLGKFLNVGPNFWHPTFMWKVDNFESSESGNRSSPEWQLCTLHNRHTNREHHLRQHYCCHPIVTPSWQWTPWWDNRFTHLHALLNSNKAPLMVAPKPFPSVLLMAS